MKSRLCLALFALAVFAACSRQGETPAPAPTPVSGQVHENAFVQADNSGTAEAARKASRDALVKQLQELLGRLEKAGNLAEAFKLAEAIEDLGKDVRPELEAAVGKLPELPRIAGLRALWTLEGWDPAVQGLLAIVEGQGATATRVSAAEVLGAVASTRHEQLLRKSLNEKVFDPEVKVQLAVALWRSARDPAATRVLRDLLSSGNESFRIIAALALGEINQLTSDAKPILEQLAEEPTLRGRTARRALDYEKAIRRLEAAIEGKHPGQPKVEKIDTRLLDSVEKMLKERFIYPDLISGRKLLYAAANGMLDGLDPYTCLLEDGQLRDAGELSRFAVPTLGLNLGSARLQPNRQVRLTRVLSVVPGSPADRAGIASGDRIYRVLRGATEQTVHDLRANKLELPDEEKSFQALPLDESLTQLQGAIGTTVGLQIMRDGWLLARWVHLTHAETRVEPVTSEMLPGAIGMIHVAELGASAPARVREALAKLKSDGAKALILDLRNAAGGSIEAATQVAGNFLPKDTLVTFSFGRSEELAPRTEYRTTTDGDTRLPLLALVNGGTCDAAEVLAGALKEHRRARVTGQKTFGRSIVQTLIPLKAAELVEDKKEAALLLTVARYMGPVSQMPWYDRGVEPDVVLKPRSFEGWIYDEFESARENPAFAAYFAELAKTLGEDKLAELARADGRNTAAYPGLDELHKKLDLHTGLEELRYLVRQELRQRLAGRIGQVDLQEDNEFTGAVKEAASVAGINLSEIPEYASLSK
ncbi:MAG: HEAT repeat domain-containing protein [Planctomycetes bacterium]|nr:HEAT repeat domain-containing protein [Planctomycetota bacterium]MCL4730262.1 HEAT repeat domain-containing protein [Planctomycetota bacterium]